MPKNFGFTVFVFIVVGVFPNFGTWFSVFIKSTNRFLDLAFWLFVLRNEKTSHILSMRVNVNRNVRRTAVIVIRSGIAAVVIIIVL